MIRFGPAGLGGVKEAERNLELYASKGLKACEIAFTYGVYIKNKDDAIRIGKKAKELDIKLSIHAPYWINLNSKEKIKIEQSKKRILDSCEVMDWLGNGGLGRVVFHPGYYGKDSPEKTYEEVKEAILDIQREIEKNKWNCVLCPETTGKVNVFGKEDEIFKLIRDTKCSFTLDFAHLLARSQGKEEYKEMYEKFKNFEQIHAHFSGINWGGKGERSHKLTPENELKKLLSILPKNKNITLINESPDPVGDSVRGLKFSQSLK